MIKSLESCPRFFVGFRKRRVVVAQVEGGVGRADILDRLIHAMLYSSYTGSTKSAMKHCCELSLF